MTRAKSAGFKRLCLVVSFFLVAHGSASAGLIPIWSVEPSTAVLLLAGLATWPFLRRRAGR
jgi:hypothetical protein